jgi:hypothetical protein
MCGGTIHSHRWSNISTVILRNSSRWLGSAVLVASLACALWTAPAASASCAPLPPLRESLDAAEVVFIGTVAGVDYDGRLARFRVEEVWKGEVGGSVLVNGGPSLEDLEQAEREGLGIATSVDRTFELGVRYLVVPYDVSHDVLADSSCSATQPYASDLDRFRPAGGEASPAGVDQTLDAAVPVQATGGPSWQMIGLLAAVTAVGVALVGFVLRRRRTRGPA